MFMAGAGILVGAAGAAFAVLAWLNARHSARVAEDSRDIAAESRNVAREALDLTRQQASNRPKISVRILTEYIGEFPANGRLKITVGNDGTVTANNVRGWLEVPADHFGHWKEEPRQEEERDTFGGLYPHVFVPEVRDLPRPSWGSLFSEKQKPKDGYYRAQVYEKNKLLPESVREFEISVRVLQLGDARVHCEIVCDEGPMLDAFIPVEVPERGLSEDDFFDLDDL